MRAGWLLLLALPLAAADDVPAWARELAARAVPEYPPKVSTVVLLSEEQVTVAPDGSRTMRERGAVRVLQRLSEEPAAIRVYDSRSGRIRSFQGWTLAPGGKPVTFGKNAIVERSAAREEAYTERKIQSLSPGLGLAPGTTFAWEIVEEEKTDFTQYSYYFQGDDPVLVSRFTLTLPEGWEARGVVLNHDPFEPQAEGTTYTWELRDLPWIEPEDYSPGIHARAPRLGVNYFPPSGVTGLRTAKDWSGVSAWLSELAEPAAQPTEPVRAKAAELTAGAGTTLDKIRAIASFVQKTNYVHVAIDMNHGGGFIPNPAAQTLARNYGDCKDKTALMRALLKAAGIESYFVSITANDRLYVRPEWPSPGQFNHEIVGVRIPAELKLPATLEHPRLGRLLLFDPTSRTTPVGDLPSDEQGSYALVLAGAAGELIKAPLLEPAARRVEDNVEAQMTAAGHLTAKVARRHFGQSATWLRYATLGEPDELKKSLERSLAGRLGGLTVERVEPVDRFDEGRFDVSLDLKVPQFGQILQDRLLVVAPGDLTAPAYYSLPAKPRKQPIEVYARAHTGKVTLTVPPQFKVDELPDPVTLASPYGSYRAAWKAEGSKILFEQSVEIKDTVAPAEEYGKMREFFEKIAAGQRSAVVLLRE